MRILSSATNLIEATLDSSVGTIVPLLASAAHAAKALEYASIELELDAASASDIKALERELSLDTAKHRIAKKRLALTIDMKAFKAEATKK